MSQPGGAFSQDPLTSFRILRQRPLVAKRRCEQRHARVAVLVPSCADSGDRRFETLLLAGGVFLMEGCLLVIASIVVRTLEVRERAGELRRAREDDTSPHS